MLHTHSFIYHPRCIMFFCQYFSFPCQYHSTNAPYSFIHLPPTLYNVFLPVLQFPLSVSFHQCSTLIFSCILLLPERQAGEVCGSSKQEPSFENWEALQTEVLSLSLLLPPYCQGCAIPQVTGRRGPCSFQISPCEICCAQSDTGTRFPHRPVGISLSAPCHLATPLVFIVTILLSQGQTCEIC